MLQNKKVKVRHEDSCTVYKYVYTDVIKVHNKYIQLNSGGWYNKPTKNLINEVIDLHKLEWSIYQRKGEWYCKHCEIGVEKAFADNIRLYNNGKVKFNNK